ncbi:unnamed protein product [Wickerhamomyces anomalus]
MSKVEAHDRILAALSDKSTFGFNELRLDKSVNDVLGDEVKIKNTLELFSFGSIKDYNGDVLNIDSTPELERLITKSIYSRIIDAKLYNEQGVVQVYSSIGRDVLLDNETEKKYGSNKRVSDLIQGLRSFGAKVEKGQKYIDEVQSSITKEEMTTTTSLNNTYSGEETTPTPSGSSPTKSKETKEQQALNNKRKRKIEGK